MSPPCGWCGLKFKHGKRIPEENKVTTLRVVWIEIKIDCFVDADEFVTTLRVVWIEIKTRYLFKCHGIVTTLRVVWIEISCCRADIVPPTRHHLAGGVD